MTLASTQAGNRASKTRRYLQWQDSVPEQNAVASVQQNLRHSTFCIAERSQESSARVFVLANARRAAVARDSPRISAQGCGGQRQTENILGELRWPETVLAALRWPENYSCCGSRARHGQDPAGLRRGYSHGPSQRLQKPCSRPCCYLWFGG